MKFISVLVQFFRVIEINILEKMVMNSFEITNVKYCF